MGLDDMVIFGFEWILAISTLLTLILFIYSLVSLA